MHQTNRLYRSVIALAICTFVLMAATSSHAATIFVRASQALPAPQQTGASWATAFKDLQAGLAAAAAGDEIWIAQGVYTPTSGTLRTASFVLKSGVHLIGGFAGNESLISQRNIKLHETILSGEIGGATTADNSFHVVRATSLAALTIVDGVTIQGGNADGVDLDQVGAGLRATDSRVTCSACTFRANQSPTGGGAVFAIATIADRRITLFDCLVIGNTSGKSINIQGNAGCTISQCTIVQNSGGVLSLGSPATASNIANSIVYSNGSGSELDQLSASGQLPNVVACLIQGWDNVNPISATTLASDPKLLNPLGPDGIAGTADDNCELRGDSPAIDHAHTGFIGIADSLDVDDDGSASELYPFDLAGNARRLDDPLAANTGSGAAPHADCGCFEYARPRTILVNHAATGANNGTNWLNAYTDLQSALSELRDPVNGGPGEIWVAQGTYEPTAGTDQTISFEPTPSVILLGGFAGGELTRAARDWRTHPTILSGDLGPRGAAGNSRHVVRCFAASAISPYIDGFTIRDGVCPANEGGGGVRFEHGTSVAIGNCLITANSGAGKGAGVNFNGTGLDSGGAILYSAIVGNAGIGSGGGGIAFENHSGTLLHCVIAGNTASSILIPGGVQIFNSAGVGPVFHSTSIFDNRSAGVATLSTQFGSPGTPVVMISTALQGFSGPIAGVAMTNVIAVGLDGGVVNADGPDAIYGTADDDLTPSVCSPLIDASGTSLSLLDTFDLDEDGSTSEVWPTDFYGANPFVDLPVPNVVGDFHGQTDIGAVERQTGGGSPDLNNDGVVDAADLALLLGEWGTTDAASELNGDCVIDAGDLAILLGAWE